MIYESVLLVLTLYGSLCYHDYEYYWKSEYFWIKVGNTYLGVQDSTNDKGQVCVTDHVITSPFNSRTDNQMWRLYKGMIINKVTGLALDIKNGLSGTNLTLYPGIHGANQCWEVRKFASGNYLANCHTARYVTEGRPATVGATGSPIKIYKVPVHDW